MVKVGFMNPADVLELRAWQFSKARTIKTGFIKGPTIDLDPSNLKCLITKKMKMKMKETRNSLKKTCHFIVCCKHKLAFFESSSI